MGSSKVPSEDALIEEGAELLRSLRGEKVPVKLTKSQRDRLLTTLGRTERNVDELLSLEEEA
jgi:hypothetical protein